MRRLVATLALVVCALPAQSFNNVTSTSGLTMAPRPFVFLGQGWCVGDFDGDGDLDIVFPEQPAQAFRYFRNDGAMSFSDQTASAGLGVAGLCRQMTPADVDNDGDQDIYVCNNFIPNQLFINDGTGTFTEEAAARGVDFASHTWAATFGDYDRDGWVDLYLGVRTNVANTYTPNRLYNNLGDGYFIDVTTAAGVGEMGLTLATMWFDYNLDGWPDIFCANDKGTSQPPNAVYRNDGNGAFTEVSLAINAQQGVCGMGLDFIDAFNDGGQDVFCTDSGADHVFIVWDPSTQQYVEMQNQLGVGQVPSIGWACEFLDYDNDAWPDLHVVHGSGSNLLWRNPAAPVASASPWTNVTSATGTGTAWAQYSSVVADFDLDGRLDILNALLVSNTGGAGTPPAALELLQNNGATGNWLRIRTRGVASNSDGLGARVRVTTGTVTQEQQVRSGIGYLTGSPMELHFGLGAATQVDRIEVIWPSGRVQTLAGVTANQGIVIREPSLSLSAAPVIGTSLSIDLDAQGDGGLSYIMGLALSATPGIPLSSGRTVPLTFDAVAQLTTTPGNGILLQPAGVLSPSGAASSTLAIPNLASLVGWNVYSAAVSLDAGAPDGVKTIIPGPVFTVQ
ncbi:MAG: hypothetical protein CMJ90_05460 [Planctomycetes bacterium]|nr:hypothetical protein [Planctomycetota bacterium]